MKPNTLEAIEIIQKFRRETGSKCCFTLDAGPNIHLLYPDDESSSIKHLIKTRLSHTCEMGRWIDDSLGQGPKKL
jgi:diphosphomevalonate decarboxylase